MTIHCITPNPAVDITYWVSELGLHATNRVQKMQKRPGGKGVNVARILDSFGHSVAVYGFLGGRSGEEFSENLAELCPQIQQRWTAVEAATRSTVAVVDSQDTTMLNEGGQPVPAEKWEELFDALSTVCKPGDWVTVSGSLPPETDFALLAQLIERVHKTGAKILIDTSGPALLVAAEAGADIVKPNEHEILEATGASTLEEGIADLQAKGVDTVIASMGEKGVRVASSAPSFSARLAEPLVGNPTGAGDAMVAGVVAVLASTSNTSPEILREALISGVSWSAAAVLSPVAGEIAVTDVQNLTTQVLLEN